MFIAKKWYLTLTVLSVSCFLPVADLHAELTLAKQGSSNYVIVVAKDAIPSERTAAEEVQSYVQKISGVLLPIVNDGTSPKYGIYIGQSARISALLGGLEMAKLKPDEIIIKTAGDQLILSGARPRGALYAVYTLVEDYWGVRFWTATETFCPKQATLKLPELNVRYAPPFAVRESTYPGFVDFHFAVRRKINGHWTDTPPAYGGREQLLGWCHTLSAILPPAEYFAKHPEWYAIYDGKRRPDGQLCLTNPEMRKEFIKRAAKLLCDNPDARLISISQNDGYGFCTCEKCQAVCRREGDKQSGVLLDFVNQMAAELEKQFPGVLVETLAYRDTRQPPKFIKPRANVIIRLCSIEADFGSPLNSEANAAFRNDVLGWSQITGKLYVWNYIANFANYFFPHPNLLNQAKDLRFLRDHNTVAIFEQGENGSNGYGDFIQLRTYLISKLMWNPDLEVDSLIHEFVTGYYGAAAPCLEAYLKLLDHDLDRVPRPMIRTYLYNTNWLSLETLAKAFKLMQQAVAAVDGQDPYDQRVKQAQGSMAFALLTRPEVIDHPNALATYGFNLEFLKHLAHKTMAQVGQYKIPQYAEHEDFRTLTKLIEYTYGMFNPPDPATLPDFCRGFKAEDVIVIPNDFFQLLSGSGLVFREADPVAVTGQAIRLATTTDSWKLIQQRLPNIMTATASGPWDLYVALRADLAPGVTQAGPVVQVGFCSPQTSREHFVPFSGEQLAGAKYKYMKFATERLAGDDYFFIKPLENAKVKTVFVDRLIMVRQTLPPKK